GGRGGRGLGHWGGGGWGERVRGRGPGGVSLFALQFARLAGARVIATSSSDEKLARVKALGASDGINYRSSPEWGETVRQLTGGRGGGHVIRVGAAGAPAHPSPPPPAPPAAPPTSRVLHAHPR